MFQILTIVGGLLTASPLIVARKPNARELFLRIVPYQGMLGAGIFALGVIWLLRWMPHLSMSFQSLSGALVLGMIVANILLGFLLGYGLLSGIFAKNEVAKAKSEALITKLRTVQIPLGVSAIALGVSSFLL